MRTFMAVKSGIWQELLQLTQKTAVATKIKSPVDTKVKLLHIRRKLEDDCLNEWGRGSPWTQLACSTSEARHRAASAESAVARATLRSAYSLTSRQI